MPRISIVIPCYNHGKFLQEAIDSVLNQTFKDFEIVIVDDGSKNEHTLRRLDSIVHPKIKKFRNNHKGVVKARNYGIKQTNSAYILPLGRAKVNVSRKYF